MKNLIAKTWFALVFLAVTMALCLFVSAGTHDYWEAWVYLCVFFGASILITCYLIKNDRALLKRRMSAGPAAEKEKSQKVAMLFASVGFIALLVVPALDHRFGWSKVPLYATIAGNILTGLGFYLNFLVFKENTFTSAIVEVTPGQNVITTGPYAIVRHPMYVGATLMFLGMPLALRSYWGLLTSVAMLPALIWRLVEEERLLSGKLPGYSEYCRKVRWRLIPGVF